MVRIDYRKSESQLRRQSLGQSMTEPDSPTSPVRKLLDNPWVVLATLFAVTGCLGIPLLFVSRGFTPAARIKWSIISIIYTALLLWGFTLIMRWCWSQIAPLFA